MYSSDNAYRVKAIFTRSILFLLSLLLSSCSAETPHPEERQDKKQAISHSSAEFVPGMPWLNVARPLTFGDLQGKVVILDFWTYGCINCI